MVIFYYRYIELVPYKRQQALLIHLKKRYGNYDTQIYDKNCLYVSSGGIQLVRTSSYKLVTKVTFSLIKRIKAYFSVSIPLK